MNTTSARSARRLLVIALVTALVGGLAVGSFAWLVRGPQRELVGPTHAVAFTTATADADYDPQRWHTTTVAITTARYAWVDAIRGGKSKGRTAAELNERNEGAADAYGAARTYLGQGTGPLGVKIGVTATGLFPTAGLKTGDVITELGGVATPDWMSWAKANPTLPGHTVPVVFYRDSIRHTTTVTFPDADLATVNEGLTNTGAGSTPAVTGLALTDNSDGGDSMGLMTALAELDATTPGDLSGGLKVYGTGTIATDGTVGGIGGADLKVQGAAAAGASVFFVPVADGNAADAKAAAADHHLNITIVAVTTLDEAVGWLCGHGSSVACGLQATHTAN